MEINKFKYDKTCPKCGYLGFQTTYCNAQDTVRCIGIDTSHVGKFDVLHSTCSRCHFQIMELPLDTKEGNIECLTH